jgi:hypothetical protein
MDANGTFRCGCVEICGGLQVEVSRGTFYSAEHIAARARDRDHPGWEREAPEPPEQDHHIQEEEEQEQEEDMYIQDAVQVCSMH